MSLTLYWVVGGGCDGDSMSLLNMESPDLLELAEMLDIEVLWHPSLSPINIGDLRKCNKRLFSGEQQLDLLILEGAVVRGPGGTGMYDTLDRQPKKNTIYDLANVAQVVLAVGTCASFGGISADSDIEATGLQFLKRKKGGFLGENFIARGGKPVINLPGCPCHPDVVRGALTALASGINLELDQYHRPLEWYGMFVHQGCTRNEYHEYRVEEAEFGERGCLFFNMGCHGPLSHGTCNKLLWNRRSSKTRVGVPCFGCTQPDFPEPFPFFETRNIEGIPIALPEEISRAHYMAYKGLAAAAAPERLIKRKTRI